MPLDVIIVQHAEKEPAPGDPGLTPRGRDQARQVGANLKDGLVGKEVPRVDPFRWRRLRIVGD